MGTDKLKLEELLERMGLRGSANLREGYLYPAMADEYVTKLYPDKQTTNAQKYYLTAKGLRKLSELKYE